MLDEQSGALHVPERTIPVPAHLSAQAQATLRMPFMKGLQEYPPEDDAAGWRDYVARTDGTIRELMSLGSVPGARVTELRAGEALAYDVVPPGVSPDDPRIYIEIHGGALIAGGGEVCKLMAMGTANRLGSRVVSIDYRMPPDHPFPVGLDDCVAIYRALLRDRRPQNIVVGGGSAGSNLAAAMILKTRDAGDPMPAGAVLLSPEVDLTESGDSFHTNIGVDRTLRRSLMRANLLYANGHDLTDPYVSPLFGDFSKGFPHTMLTAGTRDLFLSNAARMHRALRRADVPAELHIVEALSHGSFGGAPEDADIDREIRLFCEARWSGR